MMQQTWNERGGHMILRGRLQSPAGAGFHSFNHDGQVVRLNATAADILRLCDGSRTCGEIAECVARDYRNREFAALVSEFLDAALRNAWIVEASATPPPTVQRHRSAPPRENLPTLAGNDPLIIGIDP